MTATLTQNQTEIIPVKIERIRQEITDLETAIELAKNPPVYKIDEGAYPALVQVKQLLADAQSKEESAQRLAMLEEQIESRKVELARLNQVAANTQQAIESLKDEQLQLFAQYQQLQAESAQLLRKLVGYAQLIAQTEKNLKERTRDGVLFSVRSTALEKLMHVNLTDEGRVNLGICTSGLLRATSDGFGTHFDVPDYTHLIETMVSSTLPTVTIP